MEGEKERNTGRAGRKGTEAGKGGKRELYEGWSKTHMRRGHTSHFSTSLTTNKYKEMDIHALDRSYKTPCHLHVSTNRTGKCNNRREQSFLS